MKAIEQYFHKALFIMRYKVVLTFKSLDETLFKVWGQSHCLWLFQKATEHLVMSVFNMVKNSFLFLPVVTLRVKEYHYTTKQNAVYVLSAGYHPRPPGYHHWFICHVVIISKYILTDIDITWGNWLGQITISNSNWTMWSTIQRVFTQVISNSNEHEVWSWFGIKSMFTPWIVRHKVQLLINCIYNKFWNKNVFWELWA